MTARITPGTFVRLFVDSGPASVGLVTDYAHKRSDGVQFVVVDWNPNGDEPQGEPIVLAATTLVPVCAWADTYTDEWALACSEPGIPTSFDVPCHYDATREFRWVDQDGVSAESFCTDHALTASLDARRDGIPYEVTDLDDTPSTHPAEWWGRDEGGEG